MVQAELVQWLKLNPDELTQEMKDDVYDGLVDLNVNTFDTPLPPEGMVALFELTRVVLKYKGEQVESLLVDLDVLASNTGIGVEEMREELIKANRKNEQLVEELQSREKELLAEKQHTEKLAAEVAELTKERGELRREILLIQSETGGTQQSGGGGSLDLDPTTEEEIGKLNETVQSKNKHILQLLTDIEVLEKENEALTTKLNLTRRELSAATNNQAKLSGENISLRQSNYELRDQISVLEERNSGLNSQVSELVAERNRREAHLDQLVDDLEERVTKWQEIFSLKDREVVELRGKIEEMSRTERSRPQSQFATNYAILSKTVEQQEEIIDNLRDQLRQAGDELTRSTSEMQDFKRNSEREHEGSMTDGPTIEELKEELEKSHGKIAFLQEKVNDAEQDAQFRAEEMTELLIQLKEYEDGVYGLSEARCEIKEMKKRVGVRDRQILDLVQQLNEMGLGDHTPNLDEQMTIDEVEKTTGLDLKTQLYQVQQTAINLSVQNFDLRAKVIKLMEELKTRSEPPTNETTEPMEKPPSESIEQTEDENEIEERFQVVVEENEALRKGMHEILESIQERSGESRVAIESETLERLLEMLDSRHINGWYHPAMRLQAALNKMQGNNDALRVQLRESRIRESYFQAELQTAFMKLDEFENQATEGIGQMEETKESQPPMPAPRRLKADPTNEPQQAVTSEPDMLLMEPIKPPLELVDVVVQTESKQQTEASSQTELQNNEIIDPEPEQTPNLKDAVDSETTGEKIEAPEGDLKVTPSLKGSLSLELRKKCDEIKNEFEVMRNSTIQLLNDMNLSKELTFKEVQSAMRQIAEEIETMKKHPRSVQISTSELSMKAFHAQEERLQLYGLQLDELKKSLNSKDRLVEAMETKMKGLQERLNYKDPERPETRAETDKRVIALMETVTSLQEIIKQKEEVISRYQQLLRENSADYNKLFEENKRLEAAIVPQTNRTAIADTEAVGVLMEKWLARVHRLEDELRDVVYQLNEANSNLAAAKQTEDEWRHIAQSAEEKLSKDPEKELAKKKQEIEDLTLTMNHMKTQHEIELKTKLRAEATKFKKKEEHFKNKEKDYESEISRLKHLSTIRTTKTTNVALKKEFALMDRIKELEDELQALKAKEKNNMLLRKERCADEVAKWEQRKKLENTVDRLKNELRERTTQMELLENQIARLKDIITRLERERMSLQRRLKSSEEMLAKTNLGFKEDEFDDKEGIQSQTPRSRSDSSCSEFDPKMKLLSRKDLIKAVAALKKVVSKLRVENSSYVRKEYIVQMQKEMKKLQENYMDAVERSLTLEDQLRDAEGKLCGQTYIVSGQVDSRTELFLKDQLAQKCELLSKVKVLLQRTMAREKQLIQQMTRLEKLVPPEKLVFLSQLEPAN